MFIKKILFKIVKNVKQLTNKDVNKNQNNFK